MKRAAFVILFLWLSLSLWLALKPRPSLPRPLTPWTELSPTISSDGRWLAYEVQPHLRERGSAFGRQLSGETALVVMDRQTEQIYSLLPEEGSYHSPRLSGDGKKMVFVASEGSLKLSEIRFTDTSSWEQKAVHPPRRQGGHGSSFAPNISAEGRKLSFLSYRFLESGRPWFPTVTWGPVDSLKSMETPFNWRVANASGGIALSPDGDRAAWESRLLSTDRGRLRVRLMLQEEGQKPLNIHSDGGEPSLSNTHCAFVAPDSQGIYQIALYDFRSKKTQFLTGGNDDSLEPCLSSDGNFVAFTSYASDLVEGDDNGHSDVFLLELETRAITCLSSQGDGASFNPAISGDGKFVVFPSLAGNLSQSKLPPGQVYLWERGRPGCQALPLGDESKTKRTGSS